MNRHSVCFPTLGPSLWWSQKGPGGLTGFLPDSLVLSRSHWVALRVSMLMKVEALLFFFLMYSIRILKNLK